MSGLAYMSGPWDLGPYVNWPLLSLYSLHGLTYFHYIDSYNYLMIHTTLLQMISHPFRASMGIIYFPPSVALIHPKWLCFGFFLCNYKLPTRKEEVI